MKNLKVTDEQYEMLKNICHERKTQNNRSTADPLWIVETQDSRASADGFDDIDFYTYVFEHESYISFTELEDFKSEVIEYYKEHEDEEAISEIVDNLESCYDIDDVSDMLEDRHEGSYLFVGVYYYRPVAYFLTDIESKDYLKYQSHNLNNPRTYVVHSGYSNCGYMPKLLKMFKDLEFEETE